MKRALVLSGGGSRSAFEAGAIDFLVREAGLDFDMFLGTSAGALNVSVLGTARNYRELTSQSEKLKQLWLAIEGNHSVYRKNWLGWFSLLFSDALYHPSGLKQLLQKYVEPAALSSNRAKFIKIATVAIETGELFFADSREGLKEKLLDYILASASIPPFFPPVVIDGKHWYDGGLRDITPLGAAFSEKPDEVVAILTFPVNEHLQPVISETVFRGGIPALIRALHILSTEISANDLQYAQLVNDNFRLFPQMRRVPIRIVAPRGPLAGDVLDFNPQIIRANIKEGYETARNLLKETQMKIVRV